MGVIREITWPLFLFTRLQMNAYDGRTKVFCRSEQKIERIFMCPLRELNPVSLAFESDALTVQPQTICYERRHT